MHLVAGAPEGRRAFLDRVLEQLDAVYASTRVAYDRALRSRNRLLRTERPNRAAITAYDSLLAQAGAVIATARARIVSEVAASVEQAFSGMSHESEKLTLVYEPRVSPSVTALEQALAQSLDKDLARGFTAEGPHADELGFYLDGTAAKRYASQGQQRSMVLALKLVELTTLGDKLGRLPVLLLDDVSSELDRGRNARFFAKAAELGGQLFVTTTQPELIPLQAERRDYRVKAGQVSAG
jgi:DNA replication and repair protein RecF